MDAARRKEQDITGSDKTVPQASLRSNAARRLAKSLAAAARKLANSLAAAFYSAEDAITISCRPWMQRGERSRISLRVENQCHKHAPGLTLPEKSQSRRKEQDITRSDESVPQASPRSNAARKLQTMDAERRKEQDITGSDKSVPQASPRSNTARKFARSLAAAFHSDDDAITISRRPWMQGGERNRISPGTMDAARRKEQDITGSEESVPQASQRSDAGKKLARSLAAAFHSADDAITRRRKEQDITGSDESVPQASPRSNAARKLANSLAAAFHSADDAITSSRGPWMQRGERNRISPGFTRIMDAGRRKEQDITGSEESVPQASPRSNAARKLANSLAAAFHSAEDAITSSRGSWMQGGARNRISPGFTRTMDAVRRKEQDITGSEESVPQASPRSDAARKLANSLAAAFHSADDAITSSRGPWMQRGERNRISPGTMDAVRRKEQDITGSDKSVPQASPRSNAARKFANSLAAAFHSDDDAITISRRAWMQGGERNRISPGTMDAARRKEQDITGSGESMPEASLRSNAARRLTKSLAAAARKLANFLAAAFHRAEDAITVSRRPWMQRGERNRISPGFMRTMDAVRRKEQDITGSEESVPQASPRSTATRKLARSLAAAFHSADDAITSSRGPWMQGGERNRISPGVTNQCHKHLRVRRKEQDITGSEESVPQASPRSDAARKLANSLAAAFHSADDAITSSRGPWMQRGERNRISPGTMDAVRRKEQDITGSDKSVPQASPRSNAARKFANSLAAAFHSDDDAITISRRAWMQGGERNRISPGTMDAARRKEQDITGSGESMPEASLRSNAARRLTKSLAAAARKLANFLAAAFHRAEDAITVSRRPWMQRGERNRISPGFMRTMDAVRRKEQDITGSEESVPQASPRSTATRKLARSLAAAFHSADDAITSSRGPWMQGGERNRISPGVTNQCHKHLRGLTLPENSQIP
ncbi:hypothetical protein C8R43DRAFT_952166 [Mycena crocata]|nr:hypothetical protein C8R43DRAFT_952166 [Mycena crocata]